MKKFTIPYLIVLVLVTSLGLAQAQGKAYRIGPKDVISLSIYAGGKTQETASLTVSDQGMVNVPFIGPVRAGGLLIRELEALITEPLAKDYFVNPQVSIRIKEYHSIRYYLSGAVGSTGLHEMSSEASLLELIARAGGVTGDSGNVAFIIRGSLDESGEARKDGKALLHKEPIKVDLKRLFDKGDMSQNLMLKSGDVVYIPPKRELDVSESKIYLEGEVNGPGAYDYQQGITALSACIIAGGFKQFAAPNRTKIIRQKGDKIEIIKINLNDVQKGKIPDLPLEPGDRIHVPESWL